MTFFFFFEMQKDPIIKGLVLQGHRRAVSYDTSLSVWRGTWDSCYSLSSMALECCSNSGCQFYMIWTGRSAKTQVSHRYGTSVRRKASFSCQTCKRNGGCLIGWGPGEPSFWLSPENLASCQLSPLLLSSLRCYIMLCSLQRTSTNNISLYFHVLSVEMNKRSS